MTARILRVNASCGSDLTGDGTLEHPYESVHGAIVCGGYDPQHDYLMVDNLVSNAQTSASPRRKLDVLVSLVAGGWVALGGLVLVARHNPSLALLVGFALVIGWVCITGEDKPVAEQDQPRPGFRQDGWAKP